MQSNMNILTRTLTHAHTLKRLYTHSHTHTHTYTQSMHHTHTHTYTSYTHRRANKHASAHIGLCKQKYTQAAKQTHMNYT